MTSLSNEARVFNSLQDFVEVCKAVDDWRLIEGADWNEEIGALVEATAELIKDPPLLIFDQVKGYPAGYRLVALTSASYKRAALALGLPTDLSREELTRLGNGRSGTQSRHRPKRSLRAPSWRT